MKMSWEENEGKFSALRARRAREDRTLQVLATERSPGKCKQRFGEDEMRDRGKLTGDDLSTTTFAVLPSQGEVIRRLSD